VKYTKPQLKRLGSLTDLTLGASPSGQLDVQGQQTSGHKGKKP
jgi:hypothetical protein